jgi:PhnB protein
MAINMYLIFNGNCREAVEFYADVFGTERPQIMTFGDAHQGPNEHIPEEAKNLVMHTYLDIAGSKISRSTVYSRK